MKMFKYRLKVSSTKPTILRVPEIFEPLSVGVQDGEVVLWAYVDGDGNYAEEFYVIGTGWNIPEECNHFVGTVQDRGYVWHVFWVAE